MKQFKGFSVLAVVIAAMLICASSTVFAGNGYDDVYENEIDENTALAVDDIEDEDLRAFVRAANKVKEIRAFYAARIISGGDEWYEELRGEALGRMVDAIEAEDLDEDTYRGIAYHVTQDPDLLDRIY